LKTNLISIKFTMGLEKTAIVSRLQTDILRLQGLKPFSSPAVDVGLGPIKKAFPNATFPLGAVHEFLPAGAFDIAATSGFLAGLIGSLIKSTGTVLWISTSRRLFPPALQTFGIQPDRVIFVDIQKQKDVMWAMEEALKCGALAAVVGELTNIDFTSSRRLQLAVEQSQVTGFVLRPPIRHLNTTACVTRWKITSMPGEPIDNLPGVGYPQWKVELLRVRNGKPGTWEISWVNGQFQPVYRVASMYLQPTRQTG